MNSSVSVIIPNYNRQDLIIEAMDSVKSQTHRPIELIVVDDGSSDNSVKIIKEWMNENRMDEFSCQLICQENKGGNAARNSGILIAQAEYIAFLDSDDLWHRNKLEKQLKVLSSAERIGAVYCGLQHIEAENGKVIEKVDREYIQGDIYSRMLIKDETAPTSTYMIKKVVFDEVGMFDLELEARQDWDMWIRVASKYQITAVPEVLVDYRHHSGTRTASNPNKEINAYRQIRLKYADMLKMQPLKVQKAAKAAYYKRMARVHFHHGISLKLSFEYAFKAILNNPKDFDAYAVLIGIFIPRGLRERLHIIWNGLFGKSKLAIKSH